MRPSFVHAVLAATVLAAAPSVRQARPDRVPASLTRTQVESLVLLGRVWGFAKYHHPRVTGGDVDWDAELRRAVPMVLAAAGASPARDSVDRWLAALGDPPPCVSCATLPAELHLRPDVDWVRDERLLGRVLSARLQRIYANRSTAPVQRYVSHFANVGNPVFTTDTAYASDLASALPPADLRLLAVFRFWNMLEYWFPYRDQMEPDRVAILREMIPAAWDATDVARYQAAMMRLVARARDTHANASWNAPSSRPPVGASWVPVVLRPVGKRFVVSDFLHPTAGPATGLRPGDVIVRIDGAPVDSLVRAWAPSYGASNDAAMRRAVARVLLKGVDGPVRLDVERAGTRVMVQTSRLANGTLDQRVGLTHDRPGDTFQMLTDGSDSVAYLKLSTISAADIPAYVRRAAGAKGLVVDIRNYPKQFVVFTLGGHLVSEPRAFARFTGGSTANPGAFAWTPPVQLAPLRPQVTGRVAILVDETSLSQAEYTAMAFRAAPGAIVVGSTTAGADGNVSRIVLPGGVQTMISGIGVFYPDRRPTQQVGIVPDVRVEPTVAGIAAGRDEVLDAAVGRILGREVRLRP